MANYFITPVFRGVYVSLFRPTAMKGQPGAALKFSIRAAFSPDSDLTQMQDESALAAAEKWGVAIPKSLRSPFRKNADLDNPIVGIDDDWTIMAFSANEDRRPGIVNARNEDIIDEMEVYSGAYFRAQVRAFAYDSAGNRGTAFGLINVQKVAEGEMLGGRAPASKVFTPIATPISDPSALFD